MTKLLTHTPIHPLIIQYWNDPLTVRRCAARTGNMTLVEKLAWQDVFRRQLDWGRKRLHILDVGTGTGSLAMILASLGHHVTGIDTSEALLTVAKQRSFEAGLKCTFAYGDAHDLPTIEDGAFDVVIASGVVDILASPTKAFAEWGRLLNDDGKLVVIGDNVDDDSEITYATGNNRANVKQYRAAQWAQDGASVAGSYRRYVETMPLYWGDSAEISSVMQLVGLYPSNVNYAAGQLQRSAKYRWRDYHVGYTIVTALKRDSIPLIATVDDSLPIKK